MRFASLLCLILVACGGGGGATACPTEYEGQAGDEIVGAACDLDASTTCFVVDDFSSCESATYRCVNHAFQIAGLLAPADGASCAGAALASCNFEGNPDCTTEPTAQSCDCGADGLWHCACACYGDATTCVVECPPSESAAQGALCTGSDLTCAYGSDTCTCGSGGTFACH